ncbi:hypothetical protein SynRS9909_01425 [Synechococcus sp. RS9909]|nr:hypothetical protein RS9917_12865 [Synechococcus sp. RS9917]QNI79411.1 hypothetical protein SynRS9909_01425 [Synechococcus sp. RS9909]
MFKTRSLVNRKESCYSLTPKIDHCQDIEPLLIVVVGTQFRF